MSNELQLSNGGGLPAVSGAMAVEQSRAIAETQAAMVVAMSRPRNEEAAFTKIMKACERQTLAETAMYAYPRGGKMVEGPSIRLAEVLARYWGNITYGMRELSRETGISEIEAFAWDLETNTRVTRQFILKHIRDKKGGGVALKDERDIYELAANMGQRRVRACLLELIPGDIVDDAKEQCKKTLEGGGGVPLIDRIRKMLLAFGNVGVTQAMIEAYLQHEVKGIVPAQLVTLQQIYKSISDGIAKREDFFDLTSGTTEDLNKRFSPDNKKDQETEKVEPNPAKPKKEESSKEEPEKTQSQKYQPDFMAKATGKLSPQTDPDVPAPALQLEVRRCRNSLSLDKWRAENFKRIESAIEPESLAVFLDWVQEVYTKWKADEA